MICLRICLALCLPIGQKLSGPLPLPLPLTSGRSDVHCSPWDGAPWCNSMVPFKPLDRNTKYSDILLRTINFLQVVASQCMLTMLRHQFDQNFDSQLSWRSTWVYCTAESPTSPSSNSYSSSNTLYKHTIPIPPATTQYLISSPLPLSPPPHPPTCLIQCLRVILVCSIRLVYAVLLCSCAACWHRAYASELHTCLEMPSCSIPV